MTNEVMHILRDMRTPLSIKAADQMDALIKALERIREYPYIVGGEDAAPEMAAIAARALHDLSGDRNSK